MAPLEPQEKDFDWQSQARMAFVPPEGDCLRAALPRLELLYDLPLLLLSAAALPVSWQCSLISVYRGTPQCGECNNAAFGRQSAAKQTSLAPHDSKARLQNGHDSQGFMAKPCTPHLHCAARAALQAPDRQCWGSRGPPLAFSWGSKGAILSRERMAPLYSHPRIRRGIFSLHQRRKPYFSS